MLILALAQSPSADNYRQERLEWFGKVASGGTVRIENPYGNVRARFGGYENQVEILGVLQNFGAEDEGLEVRSREHGGNVEVLVGYPDKSEPTDGKSPVLGNPKDRVDLAVFIPMGCRYEVSSADGLIEIIGLKCDVEAENEKGEIVVKRTRGAVRLRSDRGSVLAELESGVTDREQVIETVTGDIAIYLWEDAHMDVNAATSGEISTDFTIQIEHRPMEEPGKYARATVGKGGTPLSLRSKQGRIRLLRLLRPIKPEEPKPVEE